MMELDLMQLICCFLIAGLTLAPLVMKVDPNLNVILTASLTVFVGCYRSVKPTPPSVSTVALIFIILTSSTTFVFFTSPDQALWNMLYLCRRQCLMSMPCVSHLLGVRCCYHYFCFLSFYQRTWSMPSWHATSLCLGSLPFRMFLPYETIIIYNSWNIIRYLFASLSYIVSLLICQGNTFTCY